MGIARALYANTSTVLLDDPLSALDRKTSASVLEYILIISKKEKRCVVLVTNDVDMLASGVNAIIVLSHGRVVDMGTFDQLRDNSSTFQSLREELVEPIDVDDDMAEGGTQDVVAVASGVEEHYKGSGVLSHVEPAGTTNSPKSLNIHELKVMTSDRDSGCDALMAARGGSEEEDMEHMERGEINREVIHTYFRVIGYGVVGLILAATFCMQVRAGRLDSHELI